VFASGRTWRPKRRTAQLRGIEQLVSQHEASIIEALAAVRRRPAFEAWMGDITVTAHQASYARRHLRAWMRQAHPGFRWFSWSRRRLAPIRGWSTRHIAIGRGGFCVKCSRTA
jgi:acyl-CoA reductase-like NAD-dependent aldehyde dehydrogenase